MSLTRVERGLPSRTPHFIRRSLPRSCNGRKVPFRLLFPCQIASVYSILSFRLSPNCFASARFGKLLRRRPLSGCQGDQEDCSGFEMRGGDDFVFPLRIRCIAVLRILIVLVFWQRRIQVVQNHTSDNDMAIVKQLQRFPHHSDRRVRQSHDEEDRINSRRPACGVVGREHG